MRRGLKNRILCVEFISSVLNSPNITARMSYILSRFVSIRTKKVVYYKRSSAMYLGRTYKCAKVVAAKCVLNSFDLMCLLVLWSRLRRNATRNVYQWCCLRVKGFITKCMIIFTELSVDILCVYSYILSLVEFYDMLGESWMAKQKKCFIKVDLECVG